MGIPVIKLNLAPPPTLWRLYHGVIAWIVFALGTIGLGVSVVATVNAYKEADRAGQKTVAITDQARTTQRQQARVLDELREIRVEHEMPRWTLAERILMERALPWSRITAELERSLVQDVRLKSVQRTRGTDQTVQLKLRGEAKSQRAEAVFIESLQENLAFAQVVLVSETEVTNSRGAIEFDYTLLLNTEPPPYELLPKYGPGSRAESIPARQQQSQNTRLVASQTNSPLQNSISLVSNADGERSARSAPAPRQSPPNRGTGR